MKIFVGMPTLGSIDARMVDFTLKLTKSTKHDLRFGFTMRSLITQARDKLCRNFLDTDCEYLLFLDDDNIPEDIDFLNKLVDCEKDIVTAIIPSRTPIHTGKHVLCIFSEQTTDTGERKYVQFPYIPEVDGEIIKIANCGMGCVLIKREVVKRIYESYQSPFQIRNVWYYIVDGKHIRDDHVNYHYLQDGILRYQRYISEDLGFFEFAKILGYEIFSHKNVLCTHIGNNKIVSVQKDIIKS